MKTNQEEVLHNKALIVAFQFIQVATVGNSAGNIYGIPFYVIYCLTWPNTQHEQHFIVGTLPEHKYHASFEDDDKTVHFYLIGKHILHAACLWHLDRT